jgi:hypothetical protein
MSQCGRPACLPSATCVEAPALDNPLMVQTGAAACEISWVWAMAAFIQRHFAGEVAGTQTIFLAAIAIGAGRAAGGP